jgi:hypothetical protein
MNLTIRNINLVSLYEEDIQRKFNISEIENEVKELFDDLSLQIIFAKFEDTTTFLLPAKQLNTLVNAKTVIVSDQSVNSYEEKNISDLIKLIICINSKLSDSTLLSYGINISAYLDFEDEYKSKVTNFKTKYLTKSNIKRLGENPDDLTFYPSFILNEEDRIIRFWIEPLIKNHRSDIDNTVSISMNVHFNKSLPGAVELHKSFEDVYLKLTKIIKNLYGE